MEDQRQVFERIRKGAATSAVLGEKFTRDALTAIEAGDFSDAHANLRSAIGYVHMLAKAEKEIGIYADTMMVLAAELQDGMTLTGLGPVQEVKDDGGDRLRVTLEDGSHMHIGPDTFVVVDT